MAVSNAPLADHAVRNAEGKYEWRDPPLSALSPVTNDGGAQPLAIAPGAPGLPAPPLPPPPPASDAPTSLNAPPIHCKAPPPISCKAPPADALVATPSASQAPPALQLTSAAIPYLQQEDGMRLQGQLARMTGDMGPGFGMRNDFRHMSAEDIAFCRTFYQQMQMGPNMQQPLAVPSMRQQELALEAQIPELVRRPLTQEQIEQIANVIRREEQGE